MAVTWSIHPSQQRVILTVTDPYTLEEWGAAVTGALDHPGFAPGFAFLVDRRGCSAPTGSFVQQQLDFLARQERLRVPHRVALVVRPEDAAAYGMARMLETLAGLQATAIQHGIFRSVDEAERWLDAAEPAGPAAE